MNRLILCEGTTDAILLSYYLGKLAGWQHCKKPPKHLDIKPSYSNESVTWYQNGEEYLLICGVGGKDNFGKFFETKIKHPLVDTNAFGKIAIVTDRDDKTVDEIKQRLLADFGNFFTVLEERSWKSNAYRDGFGMPGTVEVLLLVIPKEQAGALETMMLEAISEDPYDKTIVENVYSFVQQMRTCADRYITSERLQLKAQLGVTWAIQYPEKVFHLIDEQIKNVAWEKSEVLRQCFGILCDM